MSPSNLKIPVRSDLKIFVRSRQIIPVRSVRTFKITTETTSTNVTPFLKHIREIVDTDASTDTDSVEWKKNWMKDIIHNILKSFHKIRRRKVRMLANLDKDCTMKQLITSFRNLYPILDEYYSFAFNDDDDFEVMLTITNNMTSLTINNTTIFDDDDTTKPLDDTIIVDKTVATLLTSNRNDQTINNDNLSPDGNNNNTKESPVKAGSVINNVSAKQNFTLHD